jgi:hypothetical protein
VCLRAVDPLRTTDMIDGEEKARRHFEKLKCVLLKLFSHWEREFKHYIDEFIEDCLTEKLFLIIPEDNEGHEHVRNCLYELRCLVAGALQEWKLMQQPKHAAACGKIDEALVWRDRGYVSPILCAISLLRSPFQS